ncbi:putative AraC family transcriptional regulator [Gordonia hirsuta DSM 44140 = NBRC 16056]|uniref:Putative AraC family transcriptional regulator n=1 Tax=Gordonia hirsuta DSM 44140 = NBRC 16056 TaxID=1121927 RepID=L7LFM4_9ACTN|nr:AraC family transcriptional regulator [Gordonia hirsuta]GAC58882.1 putative AraC family transcriptional regulator [Gordonia hirsuta DSM 44140 = NBRC 16056]
MTSRQDKESPVGRTSTSLPPAMQKHRIFGGADQGITIENIGLAAAPTMEWTYAEPAHTVLVWRRGIAEFKEADFDGSSRQRVSSRSSNIWIIPAGMRSSGVARNVSASEVLHLSLTSDAIGADRLRPVVDRRDLVLRGLVERIFSIDGRDDAVARLLRESLSDSLRLHLLDAYGEALSRPRYEKRDLDHATKRLLTEYLHDALDGEVSLDTLADLAEMPRSSFRRKFAAAFGTTPHQYLMELRLDRAKSLLISTGLTVTEISSASGFASPSHFATTFKNRVGVTPTQYRWKRS